MQLLLHFLALRAQLNNLFVPLQNHLVPNVHLHHAQPLAGEQILHGREEILGELVFGTLHVHSRQLEHLLLWILLMHVFLVLQRSTCW